jgi:hypothetical protein
MSAKLLRVAEAVAAMAELVERSADPDRVRSSLDRLLSARPQLAGRLVAEPRLAERLVTVSAASRSLARLIERDALAIEVLA